jgi:hypothetical protein
MLNSIADTVMHSTPYSGSRLPVVVAVVLLLLLPLPLRPTTSSMDRTMRPSVTTATAAMCPLRSWRRSTVALSTAVAICPAAASVTVASAAPASEKPRL